tara:strand:+ start:217 stop:408 length:192 start_codon:yes stop_codon:yes gene_type:complete
MCIGGGGQATVPVKTAAQIAAETDNPYENPTSGGKTPWWKIPAKSNPPESKQKLTARLNLTNK